MVKTSKQNSTAWQNFIIRVNPYRKQIGWTLIILSTLAWVGIGSLFFLDISVAKQTAISSILFIIGELTFFGSIPFLGKDIWGSFKKLFIKKHSNELDRRCRFTTSHLSVESWKFHLEVSEKFDALSQEIIAMLSKGVTKTLPRGWSEINSIEKSKKWIMDRETESFVFTITTLETQKLAGLLLLTAPDLDQKKGTDLRLGFLFSEIYWGKGLAKELIAGLIEWCIEDKKINSLTGGVLNDNYASEMVLRGNGFTALNAEISDDMKFYIRNFNRMDIKGIVN
jgi:ribosomal-protein-alanine N-acetyltransferase